MVHLQKRDINATHTHTLHPDLTRLVNHLSRGRRNGQTPLSPLSVLHFFLSSLFIPPSPPLFLHRLLLLLPHQGQLFFSANINLVYLATCFYPFFLSVIVSFPTLSLSLPPSTAFLTLPSFLYSLSPSLHHSAL